VDGTQRDRVHGDRPHRPAAGADQRHRGLAPDAGGAAQAAVVAGAASVRSAGARLMTLWAGRVGTELAPEVWAFLRANDAELLPYDIQGTLIHARRLESAGLLSADELADVADRLASITLEDIDVS